jgi:hypothetical protein
MLKGELLITTNNKNFSIEEKFKISNVFKDKSLYEEEKILSIPIETEININTIRCKNDFKTKNKLNKNLKHQNSKDNYQDLIDNPKNNTNYNNNFISTLNLKGENEKNNKNLFEKNNYNKDNLQKDFDDKANVNELNMKNGKYKKQKKTKRVRFESKFLSIVEIESYKAFNANMCFSDLEFVDTAERKSLCKELCTIL